MSRSAARREGEDNMLFGDCGVFLKEQRLIINLSAVKLVAAK